MMQLKSLSVVIRQVDNGYTVTSVVNGEDVILIAKTLAEAVAFVEQHYS